MRSNIVSRLCRRCVSSWIVLVGVHVAITLSGTRSLAAQIGIEGIFKDVNDVSLFTTCWDADSPLEETERCPFGEHAFGFEVSFRVREISLSPKTDKVYVREDLKSVERGSDGKVTRHYDTREVREPTNWYVLLELALGYSQFGGFRSDDPDFDLRGAVREVPSVTLYSTLQTKRGPLSDFGVYAGVRTGLAQLRDLQALTSINADTVSTYLGDGQTFQIGVVSGILYEPSFLGDNISFYVERARTYRRFSSVRWSGNSGTRIPDVLPDELDFSGDSFSLGMQVEIKR